jgi:hypothetical protein
MVGFETIRKIGKVGQTNHIFGKYSALFPPRNIAGILWFGFNHFDSPDHLGILVILLKLCITFDIISNCITKDQRYLIEMEQVNKISE